MSWKNEVSEIKKRLRLIQQMGGKDKIKRQHDAGRTTVRERIPVSYTHLTLPTTPYV